MATNETKIAIKAIYDVLVAADGVGIGGARTMLVAVLPADDVDAAIVDDDAAALLDEMMALACAANTSIKRTPEFRRETLRLAIEAGVARAMLTVIAESLLVSRKDTIVLPAGRFESLSRGKGWARKGKGDSVEWGERDGSGYRVGPGKWTVGSNDGFKRKESTPWDVQHVAVGEQTWTVAS